LQTDKPEDAGEVDVVFDVIGGENSRPFRCAGARRGRAPPGRASMWGHVPGSWSSGPTTLGRGWSPPSTREDHPISAARIVLYRRYCGCESFNLAQWPLITAIHRQGRTVAARQPIRRALGSDTGRKAVRALG